MSNQPRLGKGLEALIPKTYFASGKTIVNIPIAEIKPNPYQPRKFFNDESMQSLVESVKKHGVAQPILVRRVANYYELIAGERRYRASVLAGLETIPAIIRSMTDQESLEMALIENLQREDLNSIETARGYQRLIDEFKLTHQDLSTIFGKSRSGITNILRLLSLPEKVQGAIIDGELSEGHARALLSLKKEPDILKYFEIILENKLNVREIENMVATNSAGLVKAKNKTLQNKENKQFFKRVAKQLSLKYEVDFKIKGLKNKGVIEIKFNSEDQFVKMYELLTGK